MGIRKARMVRKFGSKAKQDVDVQYVAQDEPVNSTASMNNVTVKEEVDDEEVYELKEFIEVDKLKIGHALFDVMFVDVNSPELFYGEYNGNALYGLNKHTERKIVVRNTDPYDEQLDTFLHEVLHSIEQLYHIDLGEEYVARLGTALATFLMDNNLVILQERLMDKEEIERLDKEEKEVKGNNKDKAESEDKDE